MPPRGPVRRSGVEAMVSIGFLVLSLSTRTLYQFTSSYNGNLLVLCVGVKVSMTFLSYSRDHQYIQGL